MADENPKRLKPSVIGAQRYEEWRKSNWADPEYQALYEEESEKADLWLQLVETREALGLTQAQMGKRLGLTRAQVAQLEKRGYDIYTLEELRHFAELQKAIAEG